MLARCKTPVVDGHGHLIGRHVGLPNGQGYHLTTAIINKSNKMPATTSTDTQQPVVIVAIARLLLAAPACLLHPHLDLAVATAVLFSPAVCHGALAI